MGSGGRKVREARRAPRPRIYLYPRGPNTLNTSEIGEACPVSCASSFGLQLPRSCSTCSSSPGQVVGVVKQSPPPRRRPRFGRGTRSTNRNRIFYDREKNTGMEEWVQHEARGKGKGGWKGWTSSMIYYIYIYARISERDYTPELAKSWRKSDRRWGGYFGIGVGSSLWRGEILFSRSE